MLGKRWKRSLLAHSPSCIAAAASQAHQDITRIKSYRNPQVESHTHRIKRKGSSASAQDEMLGASSPVYSVLRRSASREHVPEVCHKECIVYVVAVSCEHMKSRRTCPRGFARWPNVTLNSNFVFLCACALGMCSSVWMCVDFVGRNFRVYVACVQYSIQCALHACESVCMYVHTHNVRTHTYTHNIRQSKASMYLHVISMRSADECRVYIISLVVCAHFSQASMYVWVRSPRMWRHLPFVHSSCIAYHKVLPTS